jgi:hypothetical protein
MELIGEYHRDKVLVLPVTHRKQIELPTWNDDVQIVNELFGWIIRRGKVRIECRSEEEARYIMVLWSFDWTDFWIPTDDKYLAEILPRLLVLKEVHDEVIFEKISQFSGRKIREELKRKIYLAATLRNNEPEKEFIPEEEIISESDL